MKRLLLLIVVLALVAISGGSAVANNAPDTAISEEVITFQNDGGTVVGTLALPGNHIRGKVPGVVMLHGFTGSRDELPIIETDGTVNEAMFSRTARVFAENGVATLRIDFRGSGESIDQFTFEETTFTSQVSDALAAVDYLDDQRRIGRIGILGLSQGGLVGAVAADTHRRVRSLALWSPVANPVDTYKLILGEQNVLDGLTQPTTHIILPWGAEIDLNQPFFEDLYQVDPIAAIVGYAHPAQVVVGTRDDTVTPQPNYGEIFMIYHDGPEELVVVDGDHVFDVLAGNGAPALDEAIAESLGWFEDTLGHRR